MVKTKKILEILDTIAPFDTAEAWDNCGLQAGNENWPVNKIMIGLDVSMPLIQAAAACSADLVLTHHPLMIHPEKKIDFGCMPGSAIEMAARHQISIVSVHTNLDKASGGLNDCFAEKIGIRAPFTDLSGQALTSLDSESSAGFGRVGSVSPSMSLKQLAEQIKQQLNLPFIRVTGNMALQINRAAVCTGSGASLLDQFFSSGADLYVTGDMKYHDARYIEDNHKALIDIGHFASEQIAIDLLYEKLEQALQSGGHEVQLQKYEIEKDPFTIV